ncbi:MAG: putative redox protein [Sphingomonadales bacterium]|nr:putative redox protein [Sphingomonadales bacterium]
MFSLPVEAAVARPIGNARFATRIELPGGPVIADEPIEVGGGGEGATPYQLLSAALAACTSMTLRLYAARKGLHLGAFAVAVDHDLADGRDRFTRRLSLPDGLSAEERAKLVEVAGKCPVHRTLSLGGAEIITLAEPAPPTASEPPDNHFAQMEQACAE